MHDIILIFVFVYLFTYFLLPHLEKVYHFWMSCGCRWNPGPCYLPRSEMIWGLNMQPLEHR